MNKLKMALALSAALVVAAGFAPERCQADSAVLIIGIPLLFLQVATSIAVLRFGHKLSRRLDRDEEARRGGGFAVPSPVKSQSSVLVSPQS